MACLSIKPPFFDADLVADGRGAVLSVVRKERNVGRSLQFGAPVPTGRTEAFATRREAGEYLVELAGH